MTAQHQINRQFIGLVNRQVAELERARSMYPHAHVETVLLPKQEQAISSILSWRNSQLSRVRAFGLPPAPAQHLPPTRPNPLASPAYKQAVAALKQRHKGMLATLQAQRHNINQDISAKLKEAHKVKDKSTIQQLNVAKQQAKKAYNNGVHQANVEFNTSMEALKYQFTHGIAAGGGVIDVPSVTTPQVTPELGTQPTPVSEPAITSVPVANQPVDTGTNIMYVPFDGGGGAIPDYTNTAATPAPASPTGGILDALLMFLGNLLGGGHSAAPAPTTSSPQAVPLQTATAVQMPAVGLIESNQLDVFNDPWGYGSFSMSNRSIRTINAMPIVPRTAIGFAQWAGLASSLIQAGASIGTAAVTSALGGKPGGGGSQPVVIQQPAPQKSDNTMLLVGGGIAAVALVGILATRH